MSEALWPYFIVIVVGFLPNEVFRMAGIVLSRGIDETSELFVWIRIVATTLLAGVVARLVYAPGAALAAVPFSLRVAALVLGVAAYFGFRRSLLAGILVGEALLIGAAWWLGPG